MSTPVFSAEASLNLIWVLIGLAALTYLAAAEWHRKSRGRERVCRTIAMLIALVALFPCVSASDDSIRMESLGFPQNSGSTPEEDPNHHSQRPFDNKWLNTLARLLDALESAQVLTVWALTLGLWFFALVVVQSVGRSVAIMPHRSGRAPPALVCSVA